MNCLKSHKVMNFEHQVTNGSWKALSTHLRDIGLGYPIDTRLDLFHKTVTDVNDPV